MNCAAHDIGFVQHFLAEQNCWEEESPSGFAGAYGLAAVAAHDFHAAVQARSPVGSAEACSCAEFAGTHIPAAAAVCVVVVVVVAAAADNDADEYCSSSPFADDYSPAVAVDHVEGERSLVAAAEPCDALVPAAAAVAVVVVVAAVAVAVVVVVVVVVAAAVAVAAVFALIH